ncbi:putative ArsR family regulatory protein [Salinarchaeum sp. Harcht-Bsk1]|uniref:ArsR/SmtB family transcription factor n=1 Tax=Salinarchaeum sp. Harcht-Bsk1 TaxID=1333523 RepID=UPI00034231BD|nr:helix-turn-helix domain-containing protein [Salinarchaeum sp. Harcht-Bsk1]AGN01609.1 putative ArsR family regulatory protein [Salinarchaeum sp. Harcht-Bsk1]
MADLLPSIPDASASDDAEPRVVGLDDEDADDVLGALSSETARELFAALTDDPGHPSALADRVDTSLQNVQYHLAKLEDAGMVEVVDTAYSAKGREMDVYAPADRPLVLFAGDEEDQTLLDRALGRLLGGVGVLTGASLAVRGLAGAEQSAQRESTVDLTGDSGDAAAPATDGGSSGAAEGDDAARDTATESADAVGDGAADYALTTDGSAGDQTVEPFAQEFAWLAEPLDATPLPPELFVFVVGATLLALAVGAWYLRERQTRV